MPETQADTAGRMIEVTDETFAARVLANDGPVLAYFWAPWCGPCHQMKPVLAALAAQHADRLTIAAINLDENSGVPLAYRVLGAPTFAVFSGGEVVRSFTGARSKARMLAELTDVL